MVPTTSYLVWFDFFFLINSHNSSVKNVNQVFLDVASMGCCAPINEISMSLAIKKKNLSKMWEWIVSYENKSLKFSD